jgi:ribosomal protein S14
LKHELKRKLLKSLKQSKLSKLANKSVAHFYLCKMSKYSSKSFPKDRCLFSGRSKAIDKKTGLSRFFFRKESYISSLPGLKRASW